jgi:hypothetical protein
MPALEENHEDSAELMYAVFARLGDERLKALALVGIAASRLSAAFGRDDETGPALVSSARDLLGQISPFHVANRTSCLTGW